MSDMHWLYSLVTPTAESHFAVELAVSMHAVRFELYCDCASVPSVTRQPSACVHHVLANALHLSTGLVAPLSPPLPPQAPSTTTTVAKANPETNLMVLSSSHRARATKI